MCFDFQFVILYLGNQIVELESQLQTRGNQIKSLEVKFEEKLSALNNQLHELGNILYELHIKIVCILLICCLLCAENEAKQKEVNLQKKVTLVLEFYYESPKKSTAQPYYFVFILKKSRFSKVV